MKQDPRIRVTGQDHLTAAFFKSIADPVRLQVVARLLCSVVPMTVTEVQGCCGVHLSGVSRHLAVLRDEGVVEARKEGREVRYRLRTPELVQRLRGIADWIEATRTQVEEQGTDCSSKICQAGEPPADRPAS